ncbi:type II toxin-antitoxin system RelE/ParE family toxin [Coprothermobacter proteolyticus]|uniref:type II toxin-antitoxin system RelE/ParE family toxin n=1 Tax=Coprothermobacter proteolyticus TaxID=35786 RepID=UPI000D3043AA|nr:type II toxin-antitoxin system RelE/ParE family toxin [Coprothermobacter proteolyticus]
MNDFYKIELTQHALKDLDRLKEQSAKVLKALSALKEKPHLGHMLKGSLKGVRSLKFNINGVAYRAAYIVLEKERTCLIFMVGPHEGFYKEAERRAKSVTKQQRENS